MPGVFAIPSATAAAAGICLAAPISAGKRCTVVAEHQQYDNPPDAVATATIIGK